MVKTVIMDSINKLVEDFEINVCFEKGNRELSNQAVKNTALETETNEYPPPPDPIQMDTSVSISLYLKNLINRSVIGIKIVSLINSAKYYLLKIDKDGLTLDNVTDTLMNNQSLCFTDLLKKVISLTDKRKMLLTSYNWKEIRE
jgi:hypothetical protein